MDPEDWLRDRVNGYSELGPHDVRAIQNFTFLWSIFEARRLNNDGNVPAIMAIVDKYAAALRPEPYQRAIAHFRARYFDGAALTDNFRRLYLPERDYIILVERFVRGDPLTLRDIVAALLIIVYRIRNNLFHGNKWDGDMQDERMNFSQANDVLIAFMDLDTLY